MEPNKKINSATNLKNIAGEGSKVPLGGILKNKVPISPNAIKRLMSHSDQKHTERIYQAMSSDAPLSSDQAGHTSSSADHYLNAAKWNLSQFLGLFDQQEKLLKPIRISGLRTLIEKIRKLVTSDALSSSINQAGPSSSRTGLHNSFFLIPKMLDDDCFEDYVPHAKSYLKSRSSIMYNEDVILAALLAYRKNDFPLMLELLLSIVWSQPKYSEAMRKVFEIAYRQYASVHNIEIKGLIKSPLSIAGRERRFASRTIFLIFEYFKGSSVPGRFEDRLAKISRLHTAEVLKWLKAHCEAEKDLTDKEKWLRRRQQYEEAEETMKAELDLVNEYKELLKQAEQIEQIRSDLASDIPDENDSQHAEEEVEPIRRLGKRVRCLTNIMKESLEQQTTGSSAKRRKQHQKSGFDGSLKAGSSNMPPEVEMEVREEIEEKVEKPVMKAGIDTAEPTRRQGKRSRCLTQIMLESLEQQKAESSAKRRKQHQKPGFDGNLEAKSRHAKMTIVKINNHLQSVAQSTSACRSQQKD